MKIMKQKREIKIIDQTIVATQVACFDFGICICTELFLAPKVHSNNLSTYIALENIHCKIGLL